MIPEKGGGAGNMITIAGGGRLPPLSKLKPLPISISGEGKGLIKNWKRPKNLNL